MIYSGNNPISEELNQPTGQFVTINGERYYEISNYDAMQPFFISLASDTDLWMYLSSTGGLTAGRQSPDKSLFPYYTDDKITEQYEQTGPKTILHIEKDDCSYLWEPFSNNQQGVYQIVRRISKSTVGNKIIFCEENTTLGVRFSYIWCNADKYGWIRRATIENLNNNKIEVELLDGLQNVLPAGIDRHTQNTFSTLVDAYKKTELVEGYPLVLFRMEAILVDRAEPSESLRCNTVFTLGIEKAEYLLSNGQLNDFRRGRKIVAETESKGVRGAVFAHACFPLDGNESKTWYFVADVGKDAVAVRDIMLFTKRSDAQAIVDRAVDESTQTLIQIVGQNDGIQHTNDEYNDARHFANTLFNTMRGGFYCDNYNIDGAAFKKHIQLFNKALAEKHNAFLTALPEVISYFQLEERVAEQNDKQLLRLFYEYLPITFGRRHGDPSRPWNLFNIKVNDENGNRVISYQGNWRDIFQNWEALSLSYPHFINNIICKFLNATTVDGYNPYKITSEGIDWEVIVPEDPWSNIGYWGDHQIIYLLKLLELSNNHNPNALVNMLNLRQFAFANVPYRLKTYSEIVADPKNSIRFDDNLHNKIFSLIPTYGQDARLVLDKHSNVLLTTMIDKLLITMLAKLTNFIPQAGIWMNTLRPEWNDANNALVGYGASMVTVCYLARYVDFMQKLIVKQQKFTIAEETSDLLHSLLDIFRKSSNSFDDLSRRTFVDAVGLAGENYRHKAYNGLSETWVELPQSVLNDFLKLTKKLLEDSIKASKRDDGLYDAYNIVDFKDNEIRVKHLYEMLEGQVAVLSSKILTTTEAVDLLENMPKSELYRADQRSYMLYPNRRRKSFLEMNNIPQEAINLPIIKKLLSDYNGIIICRDCEGNLHFNGGFNNADFLARAIDDLPERISDTDKQLLLEMYESMFNHQAFTGRSGTFYKYEGLGCIYWHMVSKLLLAVGETIADAEKADASPDMIAKLKNSYIAIREGIGSHKNPKEYGSFPFDAYSHTPVMAGVQQPGMTGQVKEDIISRFFEFGVKVDNGKIIINPQIITQKDFVDGELSFTYCSTPFLFRMADNKGIEVLAIDSKISTTDYQLTEKQSAHIFNRDNYIQKVIVTL